MSRVSYTTVHPRCSHRRLRKGWELATSLAPTDGASMLEMPGETAAEGGRFVLEGKTNPIREQHKKYSEQANKV